ncbi:MAG: hypothetical protein AAF654_02820 [Myxococcota bacterium]
MSKVDHTPHHRAFAATADPSRTDGDGLGVITEAEKSVVGEWVDEQIAHFETVAPDSERLRALRTFRVALAEPGEVDFRGPVYRQARELDIDAASIDQAGSFDVELQARELDPEIDSVTYQLADALGEPGGVVGHGRIDRLRRELTDLHTLRIQAAAGNSENPELTNIDAATPTGRLHALDAVDQAIFRWRSTRDPEIRQLRLRDGERYAAELEALWTTRRALAESLGGEWALGQHIYDLSAGRVGTREEELHQALQTVHQIGNREHVSAALAHLLGVAGRAPTPEAGEDMLTALMRLELSGIDLQHALSYLEEGRPDLSGEDSDYFWHGVAEPFDQLGDWMVDNPGGAAAGVGGVAAAIYAAPAWLLAGGGLLTGAYGTYETAAGTAEYLTADRREEEVAGLFRAGEGAALVPGAMGGPRAMLALAGRSPELAAVTSRGIAPLRLGARAELAASRFLLGLGRNADAQRFAGQVMESTPTVYRTAYTMPGSGYEYASTSASMVRAFMDTNRPGASLLVGKPINPDKAFAISLASPGRDGLLVSGYRWEVVELGAGSGIAPFSATLPGRVQSAVPTVLPHVPRED